MRLSVVIPAYNERATIARLLQLVASALPDVSKEIIVVDDCSTDGTREWLQTNASSGPGVEMQAIYHERNKGKGGAIRSGLAAATGDVVVIQDADLEYDPNDWRTIV